MSEEASSTDDVRQVNEAKREAKRCTDFQYSSDSVILSCLTVSNMSRFTHQCELGATPLNQSCINMVLKKER